VARLKRFLLVFGGLLAASVVLASCGSGGAVSDARQSCVYVKAAIALEQRSQASGISATERSKLQAHALNVMLKGTRFAAAATTIDGSWNPLMTEINEAERVPIPNLEPSLKRLCRVADSSSPYMT
jgi:hypothetical protein